MKLARLLIATTAVCAAAAIPAQAAMAAPSQGTVGQARTVSQASSGSLATSKAGFHLPYTDPNQAGWLTLCGTNLKPVTSGNINTKPFVWRVVSSVPAPKVYFSHGARAVLYAYQPREQTPAGAWSGTIMATPSEFSNRLHPMAQFTPIDQPLSYMTIDFPPIFDHLIQLRLYMGAPGMAEDVDGYAAADIQVIGNTWHLVAGGNSSCTSGKVVSEETLVGMPGASGMPKPAKAGAAQSGSAAPAAGANGSTSSTSTGSGAAGSVDAADAAHSSSAVPVAAALGAVAVLVIALLAAGGIWRRRRRITG
ncbi:MAG TPA: hypothetical protein VMB74_15395 [Streptosporangiaceae bacterium]|nr:hypothetical protein [Streptosporangiaceae bacterium]